MTIYCNSERPLCLVLFWDGVVYGTLWVQGGVTEWEVFGPAVPEAPPELIISGPEAVVSLGNRLSMEVRS